MEWYDCSIPLCPPGGLDSQEFDVMEDMFHIQVEDELLGQDWLQIFLISIIDAKFEWADVAEVLDRLSH